MHSDEAGPAVVCETSLYGDWCTQRDVVRHRHVDVRAFFVAPIGVGSEIIESVLEVNGCCVLVQRQASIAYLTVFVKQTISLTGEYRVDQEMIAEDGVYDHGSHLSTDWARSLRPCERIEAGRIFGLEGFAIQ